MRKPVVGGLAAAAVEATTEAGRLLAGLENAADGRLAPVHAKLGKGIATMASAAGELAIAIDAFSKDGADDDNDDDEDWNGPAAAAAARHRLIRARVVPRRRRGRRRPRC